MLFMNRGANKDSKYENTNLDWNYSRHHQKLKYLIRDLLIMPFVKTPLTYSEAIWLRRRNHNRSHSV